MSSDCICASALRHRVGLQSVGTVRDRIGGMTETWTTYATVWAEAYQASGLRQTSGREVWRRQHVQSETTWTVTIRYRADVTTKHRVIYGARTLEVRSVSDDGERRRFLVLACEELEAP